MTYKEILLHWVDKLNKPIQFKTFIIATGMEYDGPVVRQNLYLLCRDGILVRVKYKGTASFYCKPEWVFRGKVKKELNFDPYNKTKDDNKQIRVQQFADRMGWPA